jgi:hypothetical protein
VPSGEQPRRGVDVQVTVTLSCGGVIAAPCAPLALDRAVSPLSLRISILGIFCLLIGPRATGTLQAAAAAALP